MEERPPIWRAVAKQLNCSSGQLTKGGHPAWALDEVLTTAPREKEIVKKYSQVKCFLRR
jgi:hypothetical protein